MHALHCTASPYKVYYGRLLGVNETIWYLAGCYYSALTVLQLQITKHDNITTILVGLYTMFANGHQHCTCIMYMYHADRQYQNSTLQVNIPTL